MRSTCQVKVKSVMKEYCQKQRRDLFVTQYSPGSILFSFIRIFLQAFSLTQRRMNQELRVKDSRRCYSFLNCHLNLLTAVFRRL